MGSGTSRGKKVAPARVASEVSVARTASGADKRPRKPRRVRAQPAESHSDGHDSDDEGGEVGTVVEKKPPPARKTRPRTYGLCHFSREDAEDDGAEGPRGSRGASGDVNNGSNDAFTHFKKHTTQCQSLNHSSTQGFTLKGTVATSEKQSRHSSSLTMPVILYDGSEEELMDTIERDFS